MRYRIKKINTPCGFEYTVKYDGCLSIIRKSLRETIKKKQEFIQMDKAIVNLRTLIQQSKALNKDGDK